jgi:Domain of unknown function (DUF4440)
MSAILILALAFMQPDADVTQVTRELQRIEQQLAAAWKAGDCSSWDVWIAPDWSVTHITGAVMGKPEALQMCKRPAVPITSFDIDDVRIRLFGDTAASRVAPGSRSAVPRPARWRCVSRTCSSGGPASGRSWHRMRRAWGHEDRR